MVCGRCGGPYPSIWPTSRNARHAQGLAARAAILNDRGADRRRSARPAGRGLFASTTKTDRRHNGKPVQSLRYFRVWDRSAFGRSAEFGTFPCDCGTMAGDALQGLAAVAVCLNDPAPLARAPFISSTPTVAGSFCRRAQYDPPAGRKGRNLFPVLFVNAGPANGGKFEPIEQFFAFFRCFSSGIIKLIEQITASYYRRKRSKCQKLARQAKRIARAVHLNDAECNTESTEFKYPEKWGFTRRALAGIRNGPRG